MLKTFVLLGCFFGGAVVDFRFSIWFLFKLVCWGLFPSHQSGFLFLVNSFFDRFFYFIRRKSSGCPESRFSPAVCSTADWTWSVATAPRHIMLSLKYEQIFFGWLLARLCSLQQRPLLMLQSLLVRQSSPKPFTPGMGVWHMDSKHRNPDSQSVSR